MNRLADEILNTFFDTWTKRNNSRTSRQISADLSRLGVDGSRIAQVILKLIGNACDALGGVPDPAISVELHGGSDTMKIAACDNGPGIPGGLMDKLFYPFFTTKAAGKGHTYGPADMLWHCQRNLLGASCRQPRGMRRLIHHLFAPQAIMIILTPCSGVWPGGSNEEPFVERIVITAIQSVFLRSRAVDS